MLKVMTVNIHHGVSSSGKYDIHLLAEQISKYDCDLVFAQELDANSFRTRFHNQPKIIADKLQMNYINSKVRFFGAGFQNNTIFSKPKLLSEFSSVLPSVARAQTRTALLSYIEHDGKQIALTNTHLHSHGRLSIKNDLALKQLEHIYDAAKLNSLHIIGGDFNLIPEFAVEVIEKFNFNTMHPFATSPGDNPKKQIDYITSNGKIVETFVTDEINSDHRGLVSVIEF